MAETTVGIRELKAHFSRYLRQVEAGDTVVITNRGKPVAQIIPVVPSIDEKMRQLVERGVVAWSGHKYKPVEPVARNDSTRMVSDILLEDRE